MTAAAAPASLRERSGESLEPALDRDVVVGGGINTPVNRGGKNLSATRRRELEGAKRILQRRAAAAKKTS